MDETYIKIKGKYFYYYRAINKLGDVIDYYSSPQRDKEVAKTSLYGKNDKDARQQYQFVF